MSWLWNQQFLLLIDVPIQDHSQQFSIYKIFTLDIPHGNFTAHYDVNTTYLGITQDETMVVEISQHQFSIWHAANGQFCSIHAPFQPLANPPSCINSLIQVRMHRLAFLLDVHFKSDKTQNISIPSQIATYVWILTKPPSAVSNCNHPHLPRRNNEISYSKETHPHLVQLPPTCSATSPNFHLPPWY